MQYKTFLASKLCKNFVPKLGYWSHSSCVSRGPFLEGPEKFSLLESRSKISKLMITEQFYSRIRNINRGLFTHEVPGVYTSPFSDTDELKMAFRARKVSVAFEKQAPGTVPRSRAES